jgi:hypothetical protein
MKKAFLLFVVLLSLSAIGQTPVETVEVSEKENQENKNKKAKPSKKNGTTTENDSPAISNEAEPASKMAS